MVSVAPLLLDLIEKEAEKARSSGKTDSSSASRANIADKEELESSKPVQARTYLCETPRKPKTNMYKFAPPRPHLVSSEQEQTYTNSHSFVENPAEEWN